MVANKWTKRRRVVLGIRTKLLDRLGNVVSLVCEFGVGYLQSHEI